MLRRALVAALALLLATSLPGLTGGIAAAPDPDEIYVQSVSYGGTGCPQGSVGTSFSDDRKSLTLIFDAFVASSGPNVPATENRKNCQLNLNLHIPSGWSYAVATFDYRGYVQLAQGQSARVSSTYYFQGESRSNSGASFAGPVARDYLVRDTLGAVAWMPCGDRVVPLNINSQVRLNGDTSKSGQVTIDSIDGKVQHILGLNFRIC